VARETFERTATSATDGDVAVVADHVHRGVQQQLEGRRLHAALGRLRRGVGVSGLRRGHAGMS
jgi:hypothetical protein